MGKLGWTLALLLAVLAGYIWYEPAFDPKSLRGARVVVTGCSTGIGEQMAYQYARLGARVLITARREARLKKVTAKMKDLGALEAIYVAGDMGKPEDCERTIQTAKEKFGGLDYLVLNHIGTNHKSKKAFLWDGDMDFLHDHVMINYYSYIRLASLALPLLHQTNGSLVVVGSIAGKVGYPFATFYAATKFGLDGFFISLRQELVMQDINVSVTYCVLGFIDTEPSRNFQETFEMSKDVKASPPSDCAMAIIKGGATRQREIYYPWRDAWFGTKLKPLVPGLLEHAMRSVFPPLKEKSHLFTGKKH
ncbi:HSD11B1L [Branchiostoma lanceolatum]|uniref:HSD11B1L protein n=1 Tax=Branchiostoma lanceolatum TaxID=7740 RepID=A0A8K0AJD7_BRALA|nr:HSD11B1L [Branchiostoma lanceolatum]